MLISGLKPEIHLNIKLRINDNKKNVAKLWTALETKYKTHVSDFRLELSRKLSSILMNTYNNNIQDYIADFRDILGKLKSMKYELNN